MPVKEIIYDYRLCKRCGICVDLCPASVLDWDEDGRPYLRDRDGCVTCMNCELRCPDWAIRVVSN